MRRVLLCLFVLLLLTPASFAEPAKGVVGREVPHQLGVYDLQCAETAEFGAGDIVTIFRKGRSVGEAVVLSSTTGRLRILTKGSTEAAPGDEVRFSRRPTPVSSPEPQVTRSARPFIDSSANVERLRPARLEVTRSDIFVADTGYVRVNVNVRNIGEQVSRPDTLQCIWKRFGASPVVDCLSIPPLAPGESYGRIVYSMIRADPNVLNTMRDTVYAEGSGPIRPEFKILNQPK